MSLLNSAKTCFSYWLFSPTHPPPISQALRPPSCSHPFNRARCYLPKRPHPRHGPALSGSLPERRRSTSWYRLLHKFALFSCVSILPRISRIFHGYLSNKLARRQAFSTAVSRLLFPAHRLCLPWRQLRKPSQTVRIFFIFCIRCRSIPCLPQMPLCFRHLLGFRCCNLRGNLVGYCRFLFHHTPHYRPRSNCRQYVLANVLWSNASNSVCRHEHAS